VACPNYLGKLEPQPFASSHFCERNVGQEHCSLFHQIGLDSSLTGGCILHIRKGGSKKDMFSIGDFSRITGLTIKTIRLYHEKGILVPARIDGQSGYRYYDDRAVEVALAIIHLREMGFSLKEIGHILEEYDDQADILEYLEQKKASVQDQILSLQSSKLLIDRMIIQEMEARMVTRNSEFEVEEKQLDTILIAGIRMKGCYDQIGGAFSKLCRSMGRFACGKPLTLYYDGEYKEEDADFEPSIPVRKGKEVEGISLRELPGGKCLSLIHQGPYATLSRSYAKIFQHMKENGYQCCLPTREVYIKGPGMILKGNPKNYLTEIQILIEGE